jgi:hypothetical protein
VNSTTPSVVDPPRPRRRRPLRPAPRPTGSTRAPPGTRAAVAGGRPSPPDASIESPRGLESPLRAGAEPGSWIPKSIRRHVRRAPRTRESVGRGGRARIVDSEIHPASRPTGPEDSRARRRAEATWSVDSGARPTPGPARLADSGAGPAPAASARGSAARTTRVVWCAPGREVSEGWAQAGVPSSGVASPARAPGHHRWRHRLRDGRCRRGGALLAAQLHGEALKVTWPPPACAPRSPLPPRRRSPRSSHPA